MVYKEKAVATTKDTSLTLFYPESGRSIRSIYQNGEILFCLSDVVHALAEQNTALAADGRKHGLGGLTKALLDSLDTDEKYTIPELEISDPQASQFVSQPGLFRIILRDNSPACKKFQRWVFHEVLPSLQKFGVYPPPLDNESSDVKKAVILLLKEIEERERLERETQERFQVTERRLNELSARIASVNTDELKTGAYHTVAKYFSQKSFHPSETQQVRGWCIKICAERGFRSHMVIENGLQDVAFPETVLLEAEKAVLER